MGRMKAHLLLTVVFLAISLEAAVVPSLLRNPTGVIPQIPSSGSVFTRLVSPASAVSPNIDIVGESPPDRQQVETTVAIDPHNPSIIVAGAQDLRLKPSEHRWHGFYRSTDGGQTWTNSLLPGYPSDTSPAGLSSPLRHSNATSDPVLAFDRQGNLYYTGLVFNVTQIGIGGSASNAVAFVAKYTSDGSTYSGTSLITGPIAADKPWITVDNTGGPFDGNVYLVFDAYLNSMSNFGTLFTRSIDGGKTFSAPFYAPADQTGELPGASVDGAGNVYVSSDAFNPITGIALNYTQVSKIINGGTTLVQTVRVVDPASWVTSLPGASFRAFTIPQIAADNRGVYLVFDDNRSGNANVYLSRSTNGGSTWTAPLMINDVISGQHFFPTISVSAGIISVAWYDTRQNPSSPMNTLDVYFSESLDGGVSFLPNIRITTSSFNPNLIDRTDYGAPFANSPFMGDYFEIASTPNAAYPVWADNLNACDTIDPTYGCVDQDAFTSSVSLADFSVGSSPSALSVQQGTTAKANITLNSLNNFQGTVSVSSTSNPTGLPFSPTTANVTLAPGGTSTETLSFSPAAATPTRTYTLNVTGAGGPRAHNTLLTVSVTSPPVGGNVLPINSATVLFHAIETMFPFIALILAVLTLTFVTRQEKRSKRRFLA